jgi:hypothetical protein
MGIIGTQCFLASVYTYIKESTIPLLPTSSTNLTSKSSCHAIQRNHPLQQMAAVEEKWQTMVQTWAAPGVEEQQQVEQLVLIRVEQQVLPAMSS